MTKHEAYKILCNGLLKARSEHEWCEAFRMAIENLVAHPEPLKDAKVYIDGKWYGLDEIINGLRFTVDMFLFNPSTGEKYKEPRNYMDKITIDACRGAIELLEKR